jgi:hypothetical protein
LGVELEIQNGTGYGYDSDVLAALSAAAEMETDLLAAELGAPVYPQNTTVEVVSPADDVDLYLPTQVLTMTSMTRGSVAYAPTTYQWAAGRAIVTNAGGYGTDTDCAVTGLLGLRGPGSIALGTELVLDAPLAAGGTILPTVTPAVPWHGGDMLWDATKEQLLIVAQRGKAGAIALDEWHVPETALESGAVLVYLGILRPDVERLILLRAYFTAWKSITAVPEASLLTQEATGKSSYTQDTKNAPGAASYVNEIAFIEHAIALAQKRGWK